MTRPATPTTKLRITKGKAIASGSAHAAPRGFAVPATSITGPRCVAMPTTETAISAIVTRENHVQRGDGS